MTRTDHQVLFTALGFLAVIMNDLPQDKRAARATALAKLIEEFCATQVPEAFAAQPETSPSDEAATLLERYIAELRDTGSARLNYDRRTLLGMYKLLLFQKTLREQKDFFASGHDDVIANRILQLAEEKMRQDGEQ